MKLAIGCDHGGFELKEEVLKFLNTIDNIAVSDFGPAGRESVDYPDFAIKVSEAVSNGTVDRGILICGSGVGAAVAANKLRGIRAGVCHDTYSARQAVEHDDMNVLCLGARVVGPALALELAATFLSARYRGEERHRRRVVKVEAIEDAEMGARA